MSHQEPLLKPGNAFVNGNPINGICGVRLDHRGLEIYLRGQECIRLYTFNSLMLPINAKRSRTDKYIYCGPNLGLYHDTVDMREGPYINHHINHLEITITYNTSEEALFNIKGNADLSKSYFDPNGYKGVTSGEWVFEVLFIHRFSFGS
jgi:hypothetical protein